MNKKSTLRVLIYFAFILFVWFFFAFNTANADYHAYENWYNKTVHQGLQTRFEMGFSMMMLIAAKLGLEYKQFLMIFSACGIILIAKSLYDYCQYPEFALILYFLYPYFFDIVQIRNFMAEAIIFFAIRYLREFSKKNILKYLALLVLAVFFHITAVFYLVYLLAYLNDFIKISQCILFMIVGGGIIYFITPTLILNRISRLVSVVYLENGSDAGKVWGYGAFAILANILIYIFYNNRKNLLGKYEFQFINLMPMFFVAIVAVAFSSQGYRFVRNYALIVYVVFLNCGMKVKGKKLRSSYVGILNTIFAISFAVFFFMKQLSWKAPLYQTVTKMIIENNSLFH